MSESPVLVNLDQIKYQKEITSKPLESKQIKTTSFESKFLSIRLMASKIVRIFPLISDCCMGCKQCNFTIDTIIMQEIAEQLIDYDLPLFRVEQIITCPYRCTGFPIKFHFYSHKSNNEKVLYMTEVKDRPIFHLHMCDLDYFELPDILIYKANESNAQSIIKRYDNRTIYRTYEYLGQIHYKIGKPHAHKEPTCTEGMNHFFSHFPCFLCSYLCSKICYMPRNEQRRWEPRIFKEKIYIDIFNMENQIVGKFAYYRGRDCCCPTNFFEVYFPPEANEMIRISLISQCLFFFVRPPPAFEPEYFFEKLAGNGLGVEQFYSQN